MANTLYKKPPTYDDIIKQNTFSINAKIKTKKALNVGQVLALVGSEFVPVLAKASEHNKDAIVFKDGKLYKSKKANNASELSVSDDWEELSDIKLGVLNDFISETSAAGVLLIGRIRLETVDESLKLALLKNNISVE